MGLEVGVEEDVEAEELKAVVLLIGCAALLIALLQVVLNREDRLYYHIVDALPDGLHVYPHLLEVSLQRAQRPLVTVVALVDGGVGLKCVGFLVDAVVGQVEVHVLEITLGVIIGLRRESDQTLIINVDSERLDAGEKDVDAQVKLVVVYEEGVRDVLRHHHAIAAELVLSHLQVAETIQQVYALALGALGRLHDPQVISSLALLIRIA